MTDKILRQYITDYKPKGKRDIEITQLDGYDLLS